VGVSPPIAVLSVGVASVDPVVAVVGVSPVAAPVVGVSAITLVAEVVAVDVVFGPVLPELQPDSTMLSATAHDAIDIVSLLAFII